jgi:hypothetical protein
MSAGRIASIIRRRARTDEYGRYTITNLIEGLTYKIFAFGGDIGRRQQAPCSLIVFWLKGSR